MTLNKEAKSFVTGSHAYGTPGPDSDMDLVVFVTEKDLNRLQRLADKEEPSPLAQGYINAGGTPLRFGRLNLICCTNEKYFEIWRDGTYLLRKQAPVTRQFAVEFLTTMRRKAGFSVPDVTPEKKFVGDPADHDEGNIPF